MGVSVDLAGRRVLVTGASSGLGTEVCRSVVACGGSVAMLARRKDRLDELHGELGERAVGISCDVTDMDALEAAVGEAARSLGGLDGVVAVAGKSMVGSIESGTPQVWRELFDLNLLAPLATVRYAVGHFSGTGRRDIVFIGSTGAVTPMPGTGIYAASKRGLQAAFDSLRLEVAAAGISTGLVMPGFFETEGLTLEGTTIDGDIPQNDIPMLVEGAGPAAPGAIGDTVAFMLGLPEGVAINEVVVRPTGQLAP
ncbi:MAG TPA: SDR family NAD(P)-dependent oxidoreductase [Acidimicrobiales bacterium]|nr:SDR family NAD(P)-dependent oxidoreductase [Acidimicrobiales bacterium]